MIDLAVSSVSRQQDFFRGSDWVESRVRRVRGASPDSWLAASLKNAITAPDNLLATLLNALRNDQLDWSLAAYRRGTLSGMDAAPELTWTYLQRVLRW
ncbi:hypothetical protein [Xanthomonas nasturtii]|uniref:hypothetical protein n=1 Tax=Xanthomonas nasturtii TaxID=1843581 RepID=UPI0012904611|nr:hypothetical protein [Xanthomonas nasturtii]WVL55923.1 hypothetical protein M3O54_016345 [Xanthomonas nasturtii]